MGLHDDIGDERTAGLDVHDVAHTGLWGVVTAITGSQVLVACPDFDGGQHAFGPVPTLGDAPTVGDRAFLHFDSQARAAYAAIWAA